MVDVFIIPTKKGRMNHPLIELNWLNHCQPTPLLSDLSTDPRPPKKKHHLIPWAPKIACNKPEEFEKIPPTSSNTEKTLCFRDQVVLSLFWLSCLCALLLHLAGFRWVLPRCPASPFGRGICRWGPAVARQKPALNADSAAWLLSQNYLHMSCVMSFDFLWICSKPDFYGFKWWYINLFHVNIPGPWESVMGNRHHISNMRNFRQLKQPNIFPDEKPGMFMKSNKTPGKMKKWHKNQPKHQKLQLSNNVAKSREEDPPFCPTQKTYAFSMRRLYMGVSKNDHTPNHPF